MQSNSCLIIKNDGIGDLVLASGIIAEISKEFNGNLDLITCEQNKEIADMLIGIREKYYVSRDDIQFFKFRGYNRLGLFVPRIKNKDKIVVNRLKSKKYDVAICLRRYIRQSSLILMDNIGANEKHCVWQYPTNATYKMAKKYSKGWRYHNGDLTVISELTYYQNFIEKVFETKINPFPRLNIHNIKIRPIEKKVGIFIDGNSSSYPIGYWIDIISRLFDDGWKIALFGSNNMTDIKKVLSNQLGYCENYIGSLSISETLSHFMQLSAFIGNDTGLSHLASLVVPKCLIVLGGGTFRRFFPWPNSTNQNIIFHALDCFDCDWTCKYREKYCLTLIRPENVCKAFHRMMKNNEMPFMFNINSEQEGYQIWWRNEHTLSIVQKFEDM
jgi:ADP-heptose:LPS heptosyltransferase